MPKLSFHEKLNIRCGDKCKPFSDAPDAADVILGRRDSFAQCAEVIQRGITGIIPVDFLRAGITFSGVIGSWDITLKGVDSGLTNAYYAAWPGRPIAQRTEILFEETLS